MAKVTYILGAGASAGSLPTVASFEKEIEYALGILSRLTINSFGSIVPLPDPYDIIEQIRKTAYNDLTNLLIGCREHRSIDTYAKRLFLTSHISENEELYRVTKCCITLFFELYKYGNHNKSDKRYDAFLATILNKNEPRLPDDINILSWNYDYEFESAYMRYIPEKENIHDVYADLNFIHKNTSEEKSLSNKFGIIKINGTSGFYDENGILSLGLNKRENDTSPSNLDAFYLYRLLKNYYYYTYEQKDKYKSAISFVWDEDYGKVKIETEIKEALKNTEKIIVVGYSFPYFNRGVDSYIMNCFKNYANGKIYVQAPNDEAALLLETVTELKSSWVAYGVSRNLNTPYKKIGETQFIPKSNVDQFYMAF